MNTVNGNYNYGYNYNNYPNYGSGYQNYGNYFNVNTNNTSSRLFGLLSDSTEDKGFFGKLSDSLSLGSLAGLIGKARGGINALTTKAGNFFSNCLRGLGGFVAGWNIVRDINGAVNRDKANGIDIHDFCTGETARTGITSTLSNVVGGFCGAAAGAGVAATGYGVPFSVGAGALASTGCYYGTDYVLNNTFDIIQDSAFCDGVREHFNYN